MDMKISTTFFGQQEISEESIITFAGGLPGFERATRFKLFHEEGKPTVFWLQSVDQPEVMLSVAPPELFGLGYEFALSDDEERQLDLRDPDEAGVFIVLRRAGEDSQATPLPNHPKISANLNAPLIINLRARRGLQKVLPQLEQTTLLRAR
jgi:flagellar assembly factor FliW